ncbi:MAG: transcription antitermination protein NusB [Phycisphaeraceae bacterium]|nr:transcription antitermination protein NusB [Phycisphaerales bacterium]MCB9860843.1 transcription antitermination protein NusB [Phycisphaeraceae bacterium]
MSEETTQTQWVRYVAMRLLFLLDAQPDIDDTALRDAAKHPAKEAGDVFPSDVLLPHDAMEFPDEFPDRVVNRAIEQACGAFDARERSDRITGALAPDWPAPRQAAVDRAILRLGVYELSQAKSPAPVVINELVEMSRTFGTERSPAFVNALLDKVARDLGRLPASESSVSG